MILSERANNVRSPIAGATVQMADIVHELTIRAAADKVYQAITESTGLASWWTRDCSAQPETGTTAEFRFNNRSVVFTMRIQDLQFSQRVAWHCVSGHPEWEGTSLSFELHEDAGDTVLLFTHGGWKAIDGIFGMCNFDWARYLLSLRSYCETGTGAPHTG